MHRSTAKFREKNLYTTSRPDAEIHTPVIAITDKYAASNYNGPHSVLEKGTEVTLYNVVDPTIEYKSTVHIISQKNDIVVFELLDSHFANFRLSYTRMFRRDTFYQLGIDSFRNPTWNVGTITETHFGYFTGRSHKEPRDSTRLGIFNEDGDFLGISVCNNMPIAQLADDHHTYTQIVGAAFIGGMSGIVSKEFQRF